MSTDFTNYMLSTEQQLHLARISQSLGKSPAEVLDQLLHQLPIGASAANGSASSRTLYDAFADDGSIGLIKGGSTDMSTNPKYMEGFGQSGG
jgi:hypothetical protein